MTKESAPEELVGAIKKVLAGGRYVSPSLAEKAGHVPFRDGQKPPRRKLSDREFQVLRLIASGKIVSEIAKELSLSVKTISTYRSRILEKMGMKNNAELMHYAMHISWWSKDGRVLFTRPRGRARCPQRAANVMRQSHRQKPWAFPCPATTAR